MDREALPVALAYTILPFNTPAHAVQLLDQLDGAPIAQLLEDFLERGAVVMSRPGRVLPSSSGAPLVESLV